MERTAAPGPPRRGTVPVLRNEPGSRAPRGEAPFQCYVFLAWGRALGADQVCLQSGSSLGCRMRHLLMRTSRQRRGSPALLIGSDLPSLSRTDLLLAIEGLQEHDLVLGPSMDGGYWLIGMAPTLMQRPEAWPLSGIAWGSNRVLRQTEAKADAQGLSVELLRTQQDLDHLSDMRPWLS